MRTVDAIAVLMYHEVERMYRWVLRFPAITGTTPFAIGKAQLLHAIFHFHGVTALTFAKFVAQIRTSILNEPVRWSLVSWPMAEGRKQLQRTAFVAMCYVWLAALQVQQR